MELRLDANEAWHAEELVAKVEPLVPYGICCLEQPVPHEEVTSLAELRPRLSVPIMLDESLTSLVDARRSIADKTCDVFNIRLSKCGGFLGSLRLAALAREHGLEYQLGCHPGESGLLSAAGRHWASSVAGVRWLEGSYDRHVLASQPTVPDITFGFGGWAPALDEPGLGVHIGPAMLASMTLRSHTIKL
jgi:muconate cycloisomerase